MKKSDKITVLAELNILPGHVQEVKAAAETIWKETRKESGCETVYF